MHECQTRQNASRSQPAKPGRELDPLTEYASSWVCVILLMHSVHQIMSTLLVSKQGCAHSIKKTCCAQTWAKLCILLDHPHLSAQAC